MKRKESEHKPPDEVQAAEAAILARREELDREFRRLDEEYQAWAQNRHEAEKHCRKILTTVGRANEEARRLFEEIQIAEQSAVLQVIDSATANNLDMAALLALDSTRHSRDVLLGFVDSVMRVHVPEANRLLNQSHWRENLADADRHEALANLSEYELSLRLAPAVATHGTITIDSERTVAGELRRRASAARQRAAGFARALEQSEKNNTEKEPAIQ